MKIKSSVLFGLVVLICLVGGISLMNRMNDDQGGWRPADMYSTYGGSQGSTYSSVSYGSASSADLSVPVLSSSNSLFRRRGAFSYAPAMSVSNGQLPIAGTASYSQSPIAYNQGLHTTSSAEFRSFGGGGNMGAVSMSGGSVKSSGFSSTASASVMSVSMPSTSVLAYNGGNTNSNLLTSVSGDIAMASVREAYASIGNTTRGVSGRRNVGENTGGSYDAWLSWFDKVGWSYGTGDGNGNFTYSDAQARAAYAAWVASLSDEMPVPSYEEWLKWFLGGGGSHYSGNSGNTYSYADLPIGGVYPFFVFVLLYVLFLLYRKGRLACSFV